MGRLLHDDISLKELNNKPLLFELHTDKWKFLFVMKIIFLNVCASDRMLRALEDSIQYIYDYFLGKHMDVAQAELQYFGITPKSWMNMNFLQL